MSEPIDLTITVSNACGTCKHYRFRKHNFRSMTPPEIIKRFEGVPSNKGASGGYCMQSEKVRLTSRFATCGAWELTENKTKLRAIRRKTCTHEYALGCMEKYIAPVNLDETRDTSHWNPASYRPITKYAYLGMRTRWYCKMCFTPGPYEWNGIKSHTYRIYLSKYISDLMKANNNNETMIPYDWKMTPEDKNPDYYELADVLTYLKTGRPFPEGFEVKDSWNIRL
jgi:hypothetical protein